MVEIFHHHECKLFRSAVLSKSTCFYILTCIVLFFVPLIPAFYGFTLRPLQLTRWAEFSSCDVITHESVAFFFVKNKISNRSSVLAWFGRSPNGKGLFDAALLNSDKQVTGSVEITKKEKTHVLPMKHAGRKALQALDVLLRVNIERNYEILGNQWILPIRCVLDVNGRDPMKIIGLLFEKFSSTAGQKCLGVFGRAVVTQREALPFKYDRYFEHVNSRPIMKGFQQIHPTHALLENIFKSISKRNLTLSMAGTKTAASFGDRREGLYHIHLRIDTPKQQLIYEAPLVYRLKWNFISYLSLWIIIAWPISRLRQYVFENNLLNDCTISIPTPPK